LSISSEKELDYFFNLLKTRRACRLFDPRPVPREVLDRIVYAAHRAPTGGNIPYRFVILVDDPTQLKLLKMVSPGLLGDPTALLVICTNLKIAETGGSICDVASHIDAGAAAENAVTAAYAMRLGASFIKSYSEVAVRRILEIPGAVSSILSVTTMPQLLQTTSPLSASNTTVWLRHQKQ
jgi:nitroreductase